MGNGVIRMKIICDDVKPKQHPECTNIDNKKP